MAAMPQNFPAPAGAVATYSYEDIASGLTYVVYYGNTTLDSTATLNYELIGTPQDPEEPTTSQARSLDNTHTFDTAPFKVARFYNGNTINVILPFFTNPAAGTAAPTITVYVSLFHYDGSTETQIGATVSKSLTGNTISQFEMLNALIEETDDFNFAVGDLLRLKVRIVTASSSNANDYAGICHDSKNATFTGSEGGDCRTRILSVIVPYRNDV